ncbi:pseudouridine synthase, partial [Methylibium sp. T29]
GEAAGADGSAEPGAERPPQAPRPALDPALVVERFEEVLSGAYDAEPPEPDDEASVEQSTKRVLRPEPEAPKLHKVLAQSGIGSRRDMEQFILDGKVTVNDEVAHVGMRISYGDRIAVDGKPVRLRIQPGPARLLAYHKPTGEVVTLNDPEGRPTVFRRLPRLQQGKWQSVGRLDINTEGLLLFTNSGELANQLMHPRFGVEREYAVRVLGSLNEEQRAKLLEGVEIDGQTAGFKSIEEGGGEGANRWYRVVITEGRNREVRKLFDKVGLAVSRLIRIRYGTVVLPRGLKRGVWVELDDQDLRAIRQLASGNRGAAAQSESRDAQGNREQRRNNGRNGKPERNARG